jgi:thiosulfate/3-mercaptopyruvate sulfurtransferase
MFSDEGNPLPHMLMRDERIIAEKLGQCGIRNDYKIILYDNNDIHTACRALWMFKMFGHNPHLLYILDGGFKAWEKEGGKTESGPSHFTPKTYTVQYQAEFIRTLQQMKAAATQSVEQIIDVRHPVRFAGGKESRQTVRQGHIPGSFCLPYFSLFDKEGAFLPLDRIKKKLMDLAVDLHAPVITTCGSGMTAPIMNFILDLMSHPKHALYDGSWSEWGSNTLFSGEMSLDERPVETCVDT